MARCIAVGVNTPLAKIAPDGRLHGGDRWDQSIIHGSKSEGKAMGKARRRESSANLLGPSAVRLAMAIFWLVEFVCGGSDVSSQSFAKSVVTKPNIVLFLVDDMGWQDTSVPFWRERTSLNDQFQTPNMERLAASGMKFTQAYAACVCSPSRISLMTGQNAARHRVTNWTLRRDATNDATHPTLDFPAWNVNGMTTDPSVERAVYATPLPQLLHDFGYRTIHVGKAHFGAIGTPCEDPRALGFDVNIAGHAAGGPGSYLGTQNFGGLPDPHSVWAVPGLGKYHGQDIFLSDALTQEALREMDDAIDAEQPFFLYMSHYAVHVPFAKDRRFYQKYLDAGLDETEAMYAAMVEGMDDSLGKIMDKLEERGARDRTILLFMSDNGGLSAHARGGTPHTHNAPLSSGKGSAYEGGIREPMIVAGPGIATASLCDDPLIIEDFYPTILDLAGVPLADRNTVQSIDGVSFVPLLRGESMDRDRALYWHFPNHWGGTGPGIDASSTIRQGDWKLIYFHLDQRMELYRIPADIGETHNLAAEHPEIRDRLAKQLGEYLRSVHAQMPTYRDTGRQIPYPGE